MNKTIYLKTLVNFSNHSMPPSVMYVSINEEEQLSIQRAYNLLQQFKQDIPTLKAIKLTKYINCVLDNSMAHKTTKDFVDLQKLDMTPNETYRGFKLCSKEEIEGVFEMNLFLHQHRLLETYVEIGCNGNMAFFGSINSEIIRIKSLIFNIKDLGICQNNGESLARRIISSIRISLSKMKMGK